MNTNSTLQAQGSPILLLAQLHATLPHLPQAEFHVSPIYPTRLEISVHDGLAGFETWRAALGLDAPAEHHMRSQSWLTADGAYCDAPVHLVGYGSAAEVRARAAAVGLIRPGAELVTVVPLPDGGMVVASADPTNSHSVYGVDVYRPATAAETDPEQTDALPLGALVWAEGAGADDADRVRDLVAELTAAYATAAVAA